MSDFEQIDVEKEGDMDVSSFAQVLFLNVAETYPTGAHVQCRYTITRSLVPTDRDWIGLYRVGWSTARDYVNYQWVQLPRRRGDDKDPEASVLFQAHSLPTDDGEFYQFCYVMKNGQVRGASTPFQFKQPSSDDFVEVEDDTGMLVVKTKAIALQESLDKAVHEKEELVKIRRFLEEEKEGLVNKLMAYTKHIESEVAEKDEIQKQLQETQESIQILQSRAKITNQNNEVLQERIEKLAKQKEAVDEMLVELEEKLKRLANENDALVGQKNAQEESYALQIDNLSERLRNSEDKLQAAEHCKILINEEVTALQQAYEKISQDYEVAKTDAHNIKVRWEKDVASFTEHQEEGEVEIAKLRKLVVEKANTISALVEKLEASEQQMETMKETYEKEQEGPMFALKTALDTMKSRYAKQKEECRELQMKLDQVISKRLSEEDEAELRKEIKDLRERLHMGAEEYKRKYIECQKLRKQLKAGASGASTPILEKSQTSEAGSERGSSSEEVEDLSADALKVRVSGMKEEIHQLKSKKQYYKHLLAEEKERNTFLQNHYQEEMLKKNEELLRRAEEIRQLHFKLDIARKELKENIEEKDTDSCEESEVQPEVVTATPPPVQREDSPPVEKPEVIASSSSSEPAKKPELRIHPTQPIPIPRIRSQEKSSEGDVPLNEYESRLPLVPPPVEVLKPLPPPMEPEKLHSAKAAEVRAMNGLPECHVTPEAEEDLQDTEEKFHDAPSEPHDAPSEPCESLKRCPFCYIIFPQAWVPQTVAEHVESHMGPICPMCEEQFPKDYEQNVFERHVQGHFDLEEA